ncbi:MULTISPECIES: hypothetical protein [unclassified Serratia (in: enterobacteria)]|uniref:hypothetical protein n=1 Tax=unclassified Serratia (in: enterobacteria) TaxID=2647522 RepID=UPI000469B281|nr:MULTISPECIES: hypothetical protein [unclassified Serratia (in: enterobacteria)]
MKTSKEQDDYIYLAVNYWIVTVLCGLFLGLFLLAMLNNWGGAYRLSYGSLLVTAAFYAIELSGKKRNAKLSVKNIRQ